GLEARAGMIPGPAGRGNNATEEITPAGRRGFHRREKCDSTALLGERTLAPRGGPGQTGADRCPGGPTTTPPRGRRLSPFPSRRGSHDPNAHDPGSFDPGRPRRLPRGRTAAAEGAA